MPDFDSPLKLLTGLWADCEYIDRQLKPDTRGRKSNNIAMVGSQNSSLTPRHVELALRLEFGFAPDLISIGNIKRTAENVGKDLRPLSFDLQLDILIESNCGPNEPDQVSDERAFIYLIKSQCRKIF
jgi:hypothetical protein